MAMAFNESSHHPLRKPDTRAPDRETPQSDNEREENPAKYRKKVDELNRSRDAEIERILTLRGT
jgi:hypothetical protein